MEARPDNGGWTEERAAHLLARAGFGGTPGEIAALHRLGWEGAVDRLVGGTGGEGVEGMPLDPPGWARPDPARSDRLRRLRNATEEERRAARQEEQREQRRRIEELRAWWLHRMVASPRPLEEKMVLFWHGHFATSVQKVRDAWLMYRQLDLFRRSGLGSWSDLLWEVTRDPAMLLWLDQAGSRRERPNENYAREVLELFALGEGHYSEKDIHETARALTGLTLNRETQEAEWRPRLHDPGIKSVLGRTGLLGPEAVIRHIASKPQSGRHLVGRLWRFFAGESAAEAVPPHLYEVFERSEGRVRPVLRAMFLSEACYSPAILHAQIKSPVQWLVCALRELERPLPPAPVVLAVLRELGQDLLAPPNVKGWDGGVAWINTATLTRRQQFAAVLVEGRAAMAAQATGPGAARLRQRMAERRGRGPAARAASTSGPEVVQLFQPSDLKDRPTLLTALERRFLHARMRPELAAAIADACGDDASLEPRALRAAVRVVLESTDYQLT